MKSFLNQLIDAKKKDDDYKESLISKIILYSNIKSIPWDKGNIKDLETIARLLGKAIT